jgi:hypothetical protein
VDDDDGPDRDYGEGYEDEFDEYLFEGAVGARGGWSTTLLEHSPETLRWGLVTTIADSFL